VCSCFDAREIDPGSADAVFGTGTAPTSILLTHLHGDHAGSAAELARSWHVSVYVHPKEMPLSTGRLALTDPIDRVIGPFVRLLPSGEFDECLRIATAFDPALGVTGLPDWTCIPTPGHTPGHVSYFRASDRVLITGDALLTASARSLWGLIPSPQDISPPPRISTWDWTEAMESVRSLAGLEPLVLAPGHGLPITTPAALLHAFADRSVSRTHAAAIR